jgi:hypothetical protein
MMLSGQCYSVNFGNVESSDRDAGKTSTHQYCRSVGRLGEDTENVRRIGWLRNCSDWGEERL